MVSAIVILRPVPRPQQAADRHAPFGTSEGSWGIGAGLGPSHGLWCCRVRAGLGVLWQAGLWPLAACSSWHWGYRAGEPREEKALVRQHHQVQCRSVKDTTWSSVSLSPSSHLSARWDLAVSQQDKLLACF